MKKSIVFAFVGLLFAVPSVQAQTKKFKTPQATLNAASKAFQKKNWKAFFSCFTPESRKLATGVAAFTGSLVVVFEPEKKEAIEKVFKKHGMKMIMAGPQPKDIKKYLIGVGAKVKNRSQFFGDVLEVASKGGRKGAPFFPKNGKLTKLKIKGDKATGQMVSKQGEKIRRKTFTFRRVDGSWLLEFPAPRFGPPRPPKVKE